MHKGSEEEKETLKPAYIDSEGNVDVILEEVCSEALFVA